MNRASTDVGVVRFWIERWPEANVGVRAGRESSPLVLDVDAGHGGEAALAQLVPTHGLFP